MKGAGKKGTERQDPAFSLVKALIEGMKFEIEEDVPHLSYNAVAGAAVEAMRCIARSYIDFDDEEEFCEFHYNVYASGIGFKHIANEACIGVLKDGRHLHAGITYGGGDEIYLNVDWVDFFEPQEDEDE